MSRGSSRINLIKRIVSKNDSFKKDLPKALGVNTISCWMSHQRSCNGPVWIVWYHLWYIRYKPVWYYGSAPVSFLGFRSLPVEQLLHEAVSRHSGVHQR